jgi:aryl-alcohol dehydrogenase-like predicted oxidoreductase
LTGKHRPDGPEVDSPRREGASKYLDGRGIALLAALDEIAAAARRLSRRSLAWLRAQPTVVAPIASARQPGQLAELPMIEFSSSPPELEQLDATSRQ